MSPGTLAWSGQDCLAVIRFSPAAPRSWPVLVWSAELLTDAGVQRIDDCSSQEPCLWDDLGCQGALGAAVLLCEALTSSDQERAVVSCLALLPGSWKALYPAQVVSVWSSTAKSLYS